MAVQRGKKLSVCSCCEDPEKPVVKILTLTTGEGEILDLVRFCADDWHEREITIREKSLDY